MARPRKPSALKRLQGTDRPDRERNEPMPTVGVPSAPAWVRGPALELFDALAPELAALGILTTIDGDVLADYCVWRGIMTNALEVIEAEGLTFKTARGYVQQRPEVSIASTAQKHINTLGAKLGLSPADRSRLDVVAAPPGKNKFSLLREVPA